MPSLAAKIWVPTPPATAGSNLDPGVGEGRWRNTRHMYHRWWGEVEKTQGAKTGKPAAGVEVGEELSPFLHERFTVQL